MSEWQIIDLSITLLSPLQLGTETSVGNYETTRQTIPGAVLRGAIAERALAACSQPDYQHHHFDCPDRKGCPFWQLFGQDAEPLWGFAYPVKVGPGWPFPLTARTCKYHPGYEAGDGKKHHGVHDTLVGQFMVDLLTDKQFPLRERLQPELNGELATLTHLLPDRCPEEGCDAPLKPARGCYSVADQTPDYAGRLSVRSATHVGINRARSVAEDSLLFTQESIEVKSNDIIFHARVRVTSAQLDRLQPYLQEQEYFIGRGRSRGNGHVRISMVNTTEAMSAVSKRVKGFNLTVQAAFARPRLEDPRIQTALPGTLFSITLRSPMILEHYGQPTILPQAVDLSVPEAYLLRAWARSTVVGGWHGAARLPRRTQLAAQEGSVYLYWTAQDVEDAELQKQLQTLEVQGVGAERARGYGQVTVCAPFHTHERLEYS